jgi:PadR family transcriptional regulator, regulatory protein PadR
MGRKKRSPGPGELVQGTLDMLILKTLSLGPMHGWGISRRIQQVSDEVLRVEEGSLYPALRRLELNGLVQAEWGASENNRRARFYSLSKAGRRQLVREEMHWQELSQAIAKILEMAS